MRILEGEGVKRHFGGLAAVAHVGFRIDQGEIVGLIGPNGALNEQGITILLVEQNVRHTLEIADRAYLGL